MKEMGVIALIATAAVSLLFLYYSDKSNTALSEQNKLLNQQLQQNEQLIKGMLMNK